MKMKRHNFIYSIIFLTIVLVFGFVFFHQQKTKSHANTQTKNITVKKEPSVKTLYFEGVIKPLEIHAVYAPIEGDIKTINFIYGHAVKKGQVLEVISSEKEKKDFEDALTGYLKAKQDLNTKYATWKTTEKLYQEKLVSRDSRDQDRNNYYLSEIEMIQAKSKLEELLKQQKVINMERLEKLTIADIEGIKKAFESTLTFSSVKIISPIDGIALYAEESGDGSSKDLDIGSQVKADQMLLRIGDLTGLMLQLKVNEYDVNNLKAGQKAVVTSDAFPDVTLTGIVKSVSQQAVSTEGSPTFSVYVVVPKITEKERQFVRVGMSAKVMIQLKETPSISVPITAVTRQGEDTFVEKVNSKTGKTSKEEVKTGGTTMDSVAVTSGLNEGDAIVVTH